MICSTVQNKDIHEITAALGRCEMAEIRLDSCRLSPDQISQCFRNAEQLGSLHNPEFSMLEYLMRNRGVVLSRESIREHTWSWDYDGESNIVDVYIRYLRKKIDDGSDEKLIQTVRGTGYMIKGETE